MAAKENTKTIASNKKAFHDYFVEESLEAGIELAGTEVKSLRQGAVNLKDAWCSIEEGEILVNGMHISPYDKGNIFNREPLRPRRLLLHKREILRLFGLMKQQGYTLIPLSLYFKGSLVKAGGALQGQEALRQAGGRRPPGHEAGGGPGAEGAQRPLTAGSRPRGRGLLPPDRVAEKNAICRTPG